MWKKAFIFLLFINVLLVAVPVTWYFTLPRAGASTQSTLSSRIESVGNARVEIEVGQDAVNSYLAAALVQRPEINRILSSATVDFSGTWGCDVGIKLDSQVVPFHIVFMPNVVDGNLDLQIVEASMGGTVMTDTLVNIIQLLPLPDFVEFDSASQTLHIDFSKLPSKNVDVNLVDYSPNNRTLTLDVGYRPTT